MFDSQSGQIVSARQKVLDEKKFFFSKKFWGQNFGMGRGVEYKNVKLLGILGFIMLFSRIKMRLLG